MYRFIQQVKLNISSQSVAEVQKESLVSIEARKELDNIYKNYRVNTESLFKVLSNVNTYAGK